MEQSKVTKIRMNSFHSYSTSVTEISSLYYEGSYHSKAEAYDRVKLYPNSLCVNISPYPVLLPGISSNGEKYVHSKPDYTGKDNLLNLPRE